MYNFKLVKNGRTENDTEKSKNSSQINKIFQKMNRMLFVTKIIKEFILKVKKIS